MSQQLTQALQNWWPILLVVAILIVIVFALFQPWNIAPLVSHPNPAKGYADAIQRIQVIKAGETNLNPDCYTQFMTHGQKTERVIVFAHGYTTCPQQFVELGKRFYDLGYNVLIVPVPHHGLKDRLSDEPGQLTSEELAAYADKVVDIAQGLGNHVIMAGISQGGVITSFAAQNRSDLELAVMISPGFSFKDIPTPVTVPVANIFSVLPITFDWWDPALKENTTPPYAYPRFSKHALSQIMRLGFAVRSQATRAAPAAHALIMVTNANDQAVNNEVIAQMVGVWRAIGANISTYEFDASLGLGHDVIDPSDKDAKIDVVYPKLIELINQ